MRHPVVHRTVLLLPLLALTLLAACEETGDDDSASGTDFDITVAISEVIPTVATVAFTADAVEGETAYVEFGPDLGYGVRAPAVLTDEGVWEAVLVGMKSSMDYHFAPVIVSGGSEVVSSDQELTTGPVPPELPEINIAVFDEERATGGYFVMSLLSSPSAAVIVDEDGDYLWWHQAATENFPVPRVMLSHDRQRMMYLGRAIEGGDDEYEHYIYQVSLDGTDVDLLEVHDAHHDFLELPDGTVSVITHDPRDMDGDEVLGDKIVEYHPDGTQEDIWTVWDHMEFDPGMPVEDGTAFFHSNALDYDAEDDTYAISVRNHDTIFEIDRATGDVLRTVGGIQNDYVLDPPAGEWFDKEHQFQFVSDDELLVFANGVDVVTGSRVLGYRLDDGAGTAENHWEYRAEFPLFCYTYGDVNRMENGNTLVTWSTSGQMEEVTDDGEIVWQMKASLGGGFGYTTQLDSLYPEI
jgi:hypothetical protein